MKRMMGYASIGIGLALTAQAALAGEGKVLKLDFKPGKERTTLVISHSGEGKFRLFKSEKQGSVIIEAENLSLPPALTKMVDASAAAGPVLQMTPYNSQHSGHPMAKLVLQLRGQADVTGTDIPGKYLVEVVRKAALSGGVRAGAAPAWAERDELKSRLSATQKAEEVARKLIEVLSAPPEDKHYFGSKVTFEAKDAEVPDIFRLVGESSELNIIWDPDVEGQKTSLAVKDLPWDQLLDIVIQQKGYKATVMGNVVRIMTVETFNKQAEAKKKELTISDELEPVIMSVIPLGFMQAEDMKKMIDDLLQEKTAAGAGGGTGSLSQDFKRGKIEVDTRTNSLVITNTKDSIDRIRRLAKELDVPVPQVLIDSKIVIAQEQFAKSVGASWGGDVQNYAGSAGGGGSFNGSNVSLASGATSNGLGPFVISGATNTAGGAFGLQIGTTASAQLRAQLTLSELNGLTKTIASPRVIVNNNKQASIVDGQSLTLVVAGAAAGGGQVTTVNPKLQLQVTPQVTSAGSIQMKSLTISKDSLGPTSTTSVQTDQKQLQTDVLVDSGATLVLGGIYQMSAQNTQAGIPLLKDLPFIGQLFRTDSSLTSKSELMVFITPQIVDPEAQSQGL
jgi:type IV pilus assembly protein PilQ